MNKTRLTHVLVLILLGVLALAGCGRIQVSVERPTREQVQSTDTPPASPTDAPQVVTQATEMVEAPEATLTSTVSILTPIDSADIPMPLTPTHAPAPATATPTPEFDSLEMILGAMAEVCHGDGGVLEAAAYTGGPGPHPLVVLSSEGKRHPWNDRLPEHWSPSKISATALVVCVGSQQEQTIETCQYDGGHTVERVRYGLQIQVVAAQTGEVIVAKTFFSGLPNDCPGATFGNAKLLGSPVTFDQVEDWLVSLVEMGELPLRNLEIPKLEQPSAFNMVNSVAWSPDGAWLASGINDGRVIIWDPDAGKPLHTREGHSEGVDSVVWSPDGTKLASGSGDKLVIVWDANTGEQVYALEGHTGPTHSLAWSPDGSRLASGGSKVILWDIDTGEQLNTLGAYLVHCGLAWSPDGSWLAVAEGTEVTLWDVETGELFRTLEGHTNTLEGIAWSPEGTNIASASLDGTVILWGASTGEPQHTLRGHKGKGVNAVAFSPDGTRLASGGFLDGTVILWDVKTGEKLRTLTMKRCCAWNSLAWSPEGTTLAVAAGTEIVLWKAKP